MSTKKSSRIVADVKPAVKRKLRILAANEGNDGVAIQELLARLIEKEYADKKMPEIDED